MPVHRPGWRVGREHWPQLSGQKTGQDPPGEGLRTEGTPINTDLSQERGADPQELGNHVKAEEVPVNASPCHGQAARILVLLSRFPEQILEVCFLGAETEQ